MMQVPPFAARVAPQVVDAMWKSVVFWPPSVMELIDIANPPLLVSTVLSWADVVPTGVVGNVSDDGERDATETTPVPVSATSWVEPAAVSLI